MVIMASLFGLIAKGLMWCDDRSAQKMEKYMETIHAYEAGEPLTDAQKIQVREWIDSGGKICTDPQLIIRKKR